MKILHITINEELGGAAKAAKRLHNGLTLAGIESTMLVVNRISNDQSVIAVKEIYSNKERYILLTRKILHFLKSLLNIKYDNRYNPPSLLMGTLKRLDFDIIHLHWVTQEFLNFNELLNIEKPIVWTMHDCSPFTGICQIIGSCDRFKYGCGKCPILNSDNKDDISSKEFKRKRKIFKQLNINLISPSKWLYENATQSILIENKAISIIPHGIDLNSFFPVDKTSARMALNIERKAQIILFGAVTIEDKNKGYQYLRNALEIIKVQNNPEIDLELITFGKYLIKKDLQNVKITNMGYIEDTRLLRIIYSSCDILVVPSSQESFGLVALEAMACGTPVVAFNSSGIKDIVDHRINGYLADVNDPYDLAEGIKWCIQAQNHHFLSENASLKVQDCFNIEIISKKYLNLYNSLI